MLIAQYLEDIEESGELDIQRLENKKERLEEILCRLVAGSDAPFFKQEAEDVRIKLSEIESKLKEVGQIIDRD